MADPAHKSSDSARAIRVVVAVLAAVVIAFCGWSAYQYANGSDPLAFLGGKAFQTVEEGSSSSSSFELASSSVTEDDVKEQIAQLKYDSKDVSLPKDDANVVLGKDGIWVENASDSDAENAVEDTAYRAAALAAWAREEKLEVSHVTWITEDMAGAVRIAVSYPVDRAINGEDAPQILAACMGYQISGDAYAALGENRVLSAQAKTRSGSSTSASSSQEGEGITVSVTVDGSAVGAGSSSASVTIPAGATVYDALRAAGVSINAGNTQYGLYVSSIGGLAEKEHGGTSGWTYYVDGVMPMTSCANYKLAGGESIVWRYVTGE